VRIALVYPGCFRQAGVERIVWESARHLGPRHDVAVYADYWEQDHGIGDVSFQKVAPRRRPESLLPVSFFQRATRAVSRVPHDVVVSYGVNCPAGGVAWVNSLHRAWLERKRAVSAGRERAGAMLRFVHPRHRALLALEAHHFRARRYRKVITVSDHVAADLGRLYGVPPEDTVTINNGYSPEAFSPQRSAALREEVRAELGLPADAVALLMVAHELDRKGFGVLLEAVSRVDDPRLHIVLVGRATPTRYAQRIEALGLASRLRYPGAAVDVGRYHAAADAFVLPTQYEAFCLAIVEALGSGLPVVTTDVPGAGDAIRPGVNGLLQRDPLDPGELAGLLEQLLDERRREDWARGAAESALAYRWSTLLSKAEDVLREVGGHDFDPGGRHGAGGGSQVASRSAP
jgi:UDP-glucose:(heptosyl)LPS alpha-1,3-glucosyltransferase